MVMATRTPFGGLACPLIFCPWLWEGTVRMGLLNRPVRRDTCAAPSRRGIFSTPPGGWGAGSFTSLPGEADFTAPPGGVNLLFCFVVQRLANIRCARSCHGCVAANLGIAGRDYLLPGMLRERMPFH